MENTTNTIFIDFAATLFPNRLSFLPNSNKHKLSQFNFSENICNTQADMVAVNTINELQNKAKFNLVLIDKWINTDLHQKEHFIELLCINGVIPQLHDTWTLSNNSHMQNPLSLVTEFIKEFNINNYTVILDNKYQYHLDFNIDSKVAFDHAIFIDSDNGISFKNIKEINNSIKYWI